MISIGVDNRLLSLIIASLDVVHFPLIFDFRECFKVFHSFHCMLIRVCSLLLCDYLLVFIFCLILVYFKNIFRLLCRIRFAYVIRCVRGRTFRSESSFPLSALLLPIFLSATIQRALKKKIAKGRWVSGWNWKSKAFYGPEEAFWESTSFFLSVQLLQESFPLMPLANFWIKSKFMGLYRCTIDVSMYKGIYAVN